MSFCAMLHSPLLCRRSSIQVWFVIIGVVLASELRAAPQFARDSELVDHVFDLIDRRLALMPEVAAWKYRQQRPIADPARERDVIEQSSADAEAIHLDREAARAFFSAQIVLARAIQAQLFREWESRNETPPTARDLGTEIRPQLDAIGRELLPAVYLASIALSETPSSALTERSTRLLRYPGATRELVNNVVQAVAAMRITADMTPKSAQRAGVRPGDVLKSIEGPIPADWFAGKAGWKTGEVGAIEVTRQDRAVALKLKLEAIPEEVFARIIGIHMVEGHLAYLHGESATEDHEKH